MAKGVFNKIELGFTIALMYLFLKFIFLKGKRLVEQRQRLVQLCDRSKFGWKVKKFYEQDELAVDKKDEKRMQEAERLCKFEDRDVSSRRRRGGGFGGGFRQRGGYGGSSFGLGEERRSVMGVQPNSQPFSRGPVLGDDGKPLYCYACRSNAGHKSTWRSCPNNKNKKDGN